MVDNISYIVNSECKGCEMFVKSTIYFYEYCTTKFINEHCPFIKYHE